MPYVKDGPVLRKQLESLPAAERENLVKPFLMPPRVRKSSVRGRRGSSKPVRAFLRSKLYYLLYFLIHIIFSIYSRIRQSYYAVMDRVLAILYYHHRTPELIRKDVRGLNRLPEHLSVVLTLRKHEDALETLMDEVAELAAWSSCAGIPALSIYEKTGILKSHIPTLHRIIVSKLDTYYGPPCYQPSLGVFAPHHPLYAPKLVPQTSKSNVEAITVLLLSSTDGRETLVDLTKTLAEMAQHGKVSPQDIGTKLIDAELAEMMTIPVPPPQEPGNEANGTDSAAESMLTPLTKADPDLILIFGPYVKLDGYPPWQIRLSEIFCTGDHTTGIAGEVEAVEYQRFIKGLWKYAGAEMRFGR
ncbi:putative ditrans,polycis-polyprenyl diphosphate synthase [(2E,6E)-farnesyl] [Microsporum audouinii]